MWELPNTEGQLSSEEARAFLKRWEINQSHIEPLRKAKHIFTHIEWRMSGYLVTVEEGVSGTSLTWVTRTELQEQLSLPSAFRIYTGCLK